MTVKQKNSGFDLPMNCDVYRPVRMNPLAEKQAFLVAEADWILCKTAPSDHAASAVTNRFPEKCEY
jgi:hypothetical protein